MFKKIIISLMIGLVLTTLLMTCVSAQQANEVKDSVLRLHVLANSDSEADQNLKLAVRDAILEQSAYLFEETGSKEQAIASAQGSIETLTAIAKEVIAKQGYDYDVKIEISSSFFPTKEYGDIRLPAGYYDALKVTIGAGNGKNWWCILYPPLCFGGSTEKSKANEKKMGDVLSSEDLEFVTTDSAPEIEVKFKIAELWGQLIHKIKDSK